MSRRDGEEGWSRAKEVCDKQEESKTGRKKIDGGLRGLVAELLPVVSPGYRTVVDSAGGGEIPPVEQSV